MATPAKKTTAAPAKSAETEVDAGHAEIQAMFDEAAEQGYFGSSPDETPRENYTLAGVTSGKPTPENQRGK